MTFIIGQPFDYFKGRLRGDCGRVGHQFQHFRPPQYPPRVKGATTKKVGDEDAVEQGDARRRQANAPSSIAA
jgi:hypothetical protein